MKFFVKHAIFCFLVVSFVISHHNTVFRFFFILFFGASVHTRGTSLVIRLFRCLSDHQTCLPSRNFSHYFFTRNFLLSTRYVCIELLEVRVKFSWFIFVRNISVLLQSELQGIAGIYILPAAPMGNDIFWYKAFSYYFVKIVEYKKGLLSTIYLSIYILGFSVVIFAIDV